MGSERKPIESAIDELEASLDTVARVYEWARLMGYENPRLFARHFLRYFKVRPEQVLKQVRVISILKHLRTYGREVACSEIAWAHSLPDEKALYNYLRYHLNMSPTGIREMPEEAVQKMVENLGSKFRE